MSRSVLWFLVILTGLSVLPGLSAADEQEHADTTAMSAAGADACLDCHDSTQVAAIFGSAHETAADRRSPFSQRQCESCHGALADKLPVHGDAVIGFGAATTTPVEQQDAQCLNCHKTSTDHWPTSTHAAEDIGCAGCHVVHTRRDPVLQPAQQAERCYTCHAKQRAQMSRPYVHPVRAEKMRCSSCHAAHGSATDFELKQNTLNETCYSCHAEKRGPFAFEHAPASEDCSLCHRSHGSNHPAMLTKTAHLLCQQCHSQRGHPSVSLTPAGLPAGSPSAFVLAGRCMTCHSQVHGSNHPSGLNQTR